MSDGPMRFAYADPPYIGQVKHHYAGRPNACEVNHPLLIQHLVDEYPDGWALSLSTPTAYMVMGMVEDCGLSFHRGDVRLMAWVKPFAVYKPNVNPAYAWEPIIVRGGRGMTRDDPTVRDWCAANITLKRGCPGAKPDHFCSWLFAVLGCRKGDTLDDLFPGSYAVGRAWNDFNGRLL